MKKISVLLASIVVGITFVGTSLAATTKSQAGTGYNFGSLKIISRQQWGANEDYTFKKDVPQATTKPGDEDSSEKADFGQDDPEIEKVVTKDEYGRQYVWPLQYAKDIKFIVIHHTAVMRNLDKPLEDIRNIYHSHAVEKGWGDIGYQFLIDRFGNIYEGRKGGKYVIGGHALPVNKVSVGISLMGNYAEGELPAPMLKSTIALINELSKTYNIDPLGKTEYNGKTYSNIHGHSDNSAKADPGAYFQQKFPYIRTLLNYMQSKKPKANPVKYDFAPVGETDLTSGPPDKDNDLTIRVKNKGEVTWNKKTFIENLNDKTLPKILAKLENSKVEPGGLGVFKGEIPATLISGMRMPNVTPVINGNIRTDKKFPVPIMIDGLETTYEVVSRKDPPALLKPGQTAKGWIVLKNTGNFTWKRSGKNAIELGTVSPRDHASKLFGGKNRIAKMSEKEVKPGQTGKFIYSFKAPKTGVNFTEYFQPVVENVAWLQDKGLKFTVKVENKEKPLRVALSFFKETSAKLKSSEGMKLYEGTKFIRSFEKNETVEVKKLTNGGFRVKFGTSSKVDLKGIPRFKAQNDGMMEIVNYENRPAWNKSLNDNIFKGTIEIQNIEEKFTIINELGLEDYLKGIAEVSNGDPQEKIRTIMVLARSYAQYYRDIGKKFPGKPYDLDDDPDHTQKYIGAGLALRSPNTVKAVEDTAGQIVTYLGKPILTPYFNESDGRTRSAQEAWNRSDMPYLQSVPDTFCGTTALKGHGVGLSGCGATELAKDGKSYREIIKYYYKGVEITD